MLWKNSGEFIPAGSTKILEIDRRVLLLQCSDNPIKEMASHKHVISDAVKFICFHSIIIIGSIIEQTYVPTASRVYSHIQIPMNNPIDACMPVDLQQNILPMRLKEIPKVSETTAVLLP